MNNLSLLTYTHSKCADLHAAYFGRIQTYFSELKYSFVTSNNYVPYCNYIPYDDNDSHSVQMVNALSQIPTDYVIYSQEDYILFNQVDVKTINKYIDLMSADSSIGFIRLIKSGVGNLIQAYDDELWYVDPNNDYYFSTQITIWKREVLTQMYNQSQVASIFDEVQNSPFLREMGISGLYTVKVGKQVGNHYNSLVYPYIATAKVKGSWNIAEYPNELNQLFTEYNING